MNTRSFDFDKDYADVSQWWIKQGWPALPKKMLECSGFITEKDNQKLAATWVLKTDCPVYIMEWTVGNPDVNWEVRAEAIQKVTDDACAWAKQDGASQIFTMTKNERYIVKLEQNGFMVTDSGMTHLIRSL